MHTEIEAKFQCDDLEPIRRRLLSLGGKPLGRVHEANRIFDTADRRLLAADCGLRVRQQELLPGRRPQPGGSAPSPDSTAAAAADGPSPAAILTFKGPRAPHALKSREEVETAVADAEALASILGRLGFQEVVVYEKRRETWQLGACQVALDELPRLGTWIEVEGPDETAVAEARALLALSDVPPVRATYVQMAAIHGEADAGGCRRLVFGPVGTP